MKFRDPKSLMIISFFVMLNAFIILKSFTQKKNDVEENLKAKGLTTEYTVIEDLDYFHIRDGVPQMSLAAETMRSLGEDVAEFELPKGVYNFQDKDKTLRYEARTGIYKKVADLLVLNGDVKLTSDEAKYSAEKLRYYMKKDLVMGSGGVRFEGDDPKTKDHLIITAESMQANPQNQYTKFTENVDGSLERKKKYEGKLTFSSRVMELNGRTSLAQLQGDVKMNRSSYLITAGKADIHLENFNKSLKYFVLNDDVKMTETMQTPQGVMYRKAFSERLEGFGRENRMVLSGAPRVEMGKDVIKGYRITVRENIDLIEVDDAMSDVQVKKKEN